MTASYLYIMRSGLPGNLLTFRRWHYVLFAVLFTPIVPAILLVRFAAPVHRRKGERYAFETLYFKGINRRFGGLKTKTNGLGRTGTMTWAHRKISLN